MDLGTQRLILGQNLGDGFVKSLESSPTGEDSQIVKAVRQRLFNRPDTKLLGYEVKEGEGIGEVEMSLCRQMGLPPGSGLRDVRDRLVGREKDFLLVVTGLDMLPQPDRKRIKDGLKRHIKIESLFG